MGLFVKKNHGTEYLYSLAGKKQFFLGRKDEPDNLNQENLEKAIKIIDESFEKHLKRYFKDLDEHTSHMIKQKKDRYLKKRKIKLITMLRIDNA
ncbi:MAG: hypothetical protein K8823_1173 [Cenarchaeum symbiont of Oopsacas minuta]|nr:hypothetical protein [Cenarchaeum symbiont of Oopsacas minuta]